MIYKVCLYGQSIGSFRSILKRQKLFFVSYQAILHPNLFFDNVNISFVDEHKHLGVTFSKNGKWKNHIDNLIKSATKILGIMGSLKVKLRRQPLNQIYISFLRPILEYASVKSGIIVHNYHTLSDRRKYKTLIYTFKIINGLAPDYLCSIFPGATGNRTHYPFRNALGRDIIAKRTALFHRLYLFGTISHMNLKHCNRYLCLKVRSFSRLTSPRYLNIMSSVTDSYLFFIQEFVTIVAIFN